MADERGSFQSKNNKTAVKSVSAARNILKRVNGVLPALFTFLVLFALFIGWRLRRYDLISPKQGIGYMMGILGTVLMVTLLIYPLRKRVRGFEVVGNLKMWFRVHMVLGILGPLFILFHANFHTGSLNSNVALFCMLVVSGSGVIGRYMYGRIHYGLYGQRASLIELQKDFEQQKEEVGLHFALIPGVKEELISFAKSVLVPSMALVDSVRRLLTTRWKAQHAHWKIQNITAAYLNQYAVNHKWGFFRRRRMQMQIQRKTRAFLNQAVKVVEFNFYERLFSLWHMLHVPLVFILAIAVIMHIIAVNRY